MNTLERILKLIEQKGLSNNRFEKEAGLAIASIQAWKSGKAKPSLQSLQKIATYCNVSVEYLLRQYRKNAVFWLFLVKKWRFLLYLTTLKCY